MLDSTLRPVKDRLLQPLVRTAVGRLAPGVITTVALACSLAAAVAAWQNWSIIAVALWLIGRIADGLDGLAARFQGTSSDVGGLLDFVFDTIGYAAIPIGIAFGTDTRVGWTVTALLLASFYVNAVSLGHVAAVLEQRALGAAVRGAPTSVTMPRGLIEGTETIVFFTVALAVPGASSVVWSIMAVAVVVTAIERLIWAARTLR